MELTWIELFDSRSSVNISFPWLCQRPETDEPKQREGFTSARSGLLWGLWRGEVERRIWERVAQPHFTSPADWRLEMKAGFPTSPSSPSLFQRCKSTFPSFLQSPHLQTCCVGIQASAHGLTRYPDPSYYNVSQV